MTEIAPGWMVGDKSYLITTASETVGPKKGERTIHWTASCWATEGALLCGHGSIEEAAILDLKLSIMACYHREALEERLQEINKLPAPMMGYLVADSLKKAVNGLWEPAFHQVDYQVPLGSSPNRCMVKRSYIGDPEEFNPLDNDLHALEVWKYFTYMEPGTSTTLETGPNYMTTCTVSRPWTADIVGQGHTIGQAVCRAFMRLVVAVRDPNEIAKLQQEALEERVKSLYTGLPSLELGKFDFPVLDNPELRVGQPPAEYRYDLTEFLDDDRDREQ